LNVYIDSLCDVRYPASYNGSFSIVLSEPY
jgi:hypothetical protein